MKGIIATVELALQSGRGDILRALIADNGVALRDPDPIGEDEVAYLVETLAALVERNAEYYRRRDALRDEARAVIGSFRTGTASALGRLLAVADPRSPVEGEGLKERAKEIAATLLDEEWPVSDETWPPV